MRLIVIAATIAATLPAAAAPVPLAAHHAVYDLTLGSVKSGDTLAASGSMTYDVGDACTNWTTQQALKLHIVTRNGASDTVSDYTTLESKDGRKLSFDTSQRANGAVVQQVRGEATATASGGSIHYTLPKPTQVALPPGTLFPMAHTAAIIAGAEAGRKTLSLPLFDGTGADGAQDTFVLLLGWQKAGDDKPPFPALDGLAHGRVHVAFFTHGQAGMTPDYEAGMRYYANGVADRLDMDFGAFRMTGTLKSFTPGKPGRC